ncbi:MAG: hypothetical protein K2O70_06005, partial [Desulfovibrionaceae bacterium]|nr:hypothetical protein [Desulfovibrionaceae bacterium]
MLKIYSVSLGCPKNRVDTEHLLGSLGAAVRPAEHMGRADVVLINTCGFIRPAVEESVGAPGGGAGGGGGPGRGAHGGGGGAPRGRGPAAGAPPPHARAGA